MTIPDLKPSSQDTSAFYLGKIYEVLADPNVTSSSISPSVVNPPPFSPPRPAIWVNVLFLLSLVISISCALLATLWQQWARRYLYLTQHAAPRPEERARIRAYFKQGVDTMYISLAVEGLPTLLHLSLFLFFGGLVIYLFSVNKEVSAYVVVCIGFFLTVYGLVTLLPLIRHDSPYNTPLSAPVWYLNARIQYVTFTVLVVIDGYYSTWTRTRERFHGLRERCHDWMLGGVEKAAWRKALEPSLEIDLQIFGRTISTIIDDDSLAKFFETIPGFFKSEQDRGLEEYFPGDLFEAFWGTLDGFMGRTLSSNSVTKSVKYRRASICKDIMKIIPCSESFNLRTYFDQEPATVEWVRATKRWFPNRSHNVSNAARAMFAKNIARISKDYDLQVWVPLASEAYGFPDLPKVAFSRNGAMLALLIHLCRQVKDSDELGPVETFTEFDICDTLPGLQHDFCTLWNELILKARPIDTSNRILSLLHHRYMDLHRGNRGTDFRLSVIGSDILLPLSSYPSCNIASHRPVFIPAIAVIGPSSDSLPASIIPVVIQETPPESLLPTLTSAADSVTIAPVSPNLSTHQERMLSPADAANRITGTSIVVPENTSPTHGDWVPAVIKFNQDGYFSELLHYLPHSVLYEGMLYPTVLHLLEARKFLPHRPDLAERIRQCERVEQATSISAKLADSNFIPRDWDSNMISMVSNFPLQPAPLLG